VEKEDVMVRGHHDALQRALSNVLLNAADASGPGGKIEVGVELTQIARADAVEIHVRDSGPGIPPERIQSIWEPYITSKPGRHRCWGWLSRVRRSWRMMEASTSSAPQTVGRW
jgi:signal transduction histidine kinase